MRLWDEGRYASKEPRSFKRGDQQLGRFVMPAVNASKEPRSFKRGDDECEWHAWDGAVGLQRSHVHLNVVTYPRRRSARVAVASKEPRSFKRGDYNRRQRLDNNRYRLQRSHVHLNVVTRTWMRGTSGSSPSFKGATFI